MKCSLGECIYLKFLLSVFNYKLYIIINFEKEQKSLIDPENYDKYRRHINAESMFTAF